MLAKLIVGLVCWTLVTMVLYDVVISNSFRFRFARIFQHDAAAVTSHNKQNKVEAWRSFKKRLAANDATTVEQKSVVINSSNNNPLHAVFLLTPTPEPEIDKLIAWLSNEHKTFTNATVLNHHTQLLQAELGLFEKKSVKSWKDFPLWMHADLDLNSNAQEEFTNQVLQSVTATEQAFIFHSDFLPQTLVQWKLALSKATGKQVKTTCVLAKRPSMSEQVLLGVNQMQYNRMSATEVKRALRRRLQHLAALCSSSEQLEFQLNDGITWQEIALPRFSLSNNRNPQSSPQLTALYNEAVGNIRDSMKRIDDEAYVSILTALQPTNKTSFLYSNNNNVLPEYLEGVIGLGRSLSFFDSSRERILMVTRTKEEEAEDPLLLHAANEGGWTIRYVEPIYDQWFARAERGCRFRASRTHQNIRWGRMASKMRAFEMYDKKALLYLDLDIVVTGKVSELFHQVPQDFVCVSEGGVQHAYLNAGFLYLRPSKRTFEGLMKHFNGNDAPEIFGNLIDCTEMGLLNVYFGQPERLMESSNSSNAVLVWPRTQPQEDRGRTGTLPLGAHTWTVGRPDLSRDFVQAPPLAVHFIRKDICPKPWEMCIDNDNEEEDQMPKLRPKCHGFPYVAWCAFRGRGAPRLHRRVETID